MTTTRFDPYEWAKHASGEEVFSPGDIARHAAAQINMLLRENDDPELQQAALRVLNIFGAIVSEGENAMLDPDRFRAAMTRMYVMGVEAMRLAIIAETDDEAERAALIEKFRRDTIANHARQALEKRHNKPDGSRAKREAIRAIWATGKYSSRDICAEQECAALGMSFSAARKALRNTPDPA